MDKITEREQEVIDLVLKGLTNKQIAKELNISYYTVCAHLIHIFDKCECTKGKIDLFIQRIEKLEQKLNEVENE